ncbi:MAG: zf-TFIIB domain-containing protein [Thermoleophilia bacterium]|mgnify:CR=1 FL=1
MNCPVCKNVSLVMTERQGIEIDYCPECRGVWLDRGELEKIIERSETQMDAHRPERAVYDPQFREYKHDAYYKHGDARHSGHSNHQKSKSYKSLLGDLLDF